MKKILIILLLAISGYSECNITIDIEKLQEVTYELAVTTTNNIVGSGTAVAISPNGKLVTAYHSIDSAKKVIAIDSSGTEHNVTLGKISKMNDLAYIHIEAKNISYAKLSTKKLKLANEIYILNYENTIFKGIVSSIKNDGLITNVEISIGTSGGGVFNTDNELIAIALRKDNLDKTSFASTINMFEQINENYEPKKILSELDSTNNYDYSYCEDKEDLAIWKKHEKSSNLKIQEFHALFIGLCAKVKNRDLTTEEAQYIFESAREKL